MGAAGSNAAKSSLKRAFPTATSAGRGAEAGGAVATRFGGAARGGGQTADGDALQPPPKHIPKHLQAAAAEAAGALDHRIMARSDVVVAGRALDDGPDSTTMDGPLDLDQLAEVVKPGLFSAGMTRADTLASGKQEIYVQQLRERYEAEVGPPGGHMDQDLDGWLKELGGLDVSTETREVISGAGGANRVPVGGDGTNSRSSAS